MKLRTLILAAIVAFSCAKEEAEQVPAEEPIVSDDRQVPPIDIDPENDPRTAKVIEGELLPAVEYFEKLAGNLITTPMEFSLLEEGVLGVCITWFNGVLRFKEILIDEPSYREFAARDLFGAYNIILHELGHCENDRDHISVLANSPDGTIPFSIMYPAIFRDLSLYTTYVGHYMDELFGGRGTLTPIDSSAATKAVRKTIYRKGFTGTVIYD